MYTLIVYVLVFDSYFRVRGKGFKKPSNFKTSSFKRGYLTYYFFVRGNIISDLNWIQNWSEFSLPWTFKFERQTFVKKTKFRDLKCFNFSGLVAVLRNAAALLRPILRWNVEATRGRSQSLPQNQGPGPEADLKRKICSRR